MRRAAILLGILAPFSTIGGPADRAPVLVELFTSEGCSSCPPADKLLQLLDPKVIALSEHVDYWDHDGWKDPNSSHELTVRQQGYADRLNAAEGPYTPQMVVDGQFQFNGSDARKAADVLLQQSQKPKVPIVLSRGDGGVDIRIADAPEHADVYVAFAQDHGASDVRGGENKGLHMEHVAIVHSLKKVASISHGGPFALTTRVPKEYAGNRVVVFLQQKFPGAVLGAAELGPN